MHPLRNNFFVHGFALVGTLAATARSYTAPAKVESFLDKFRNYSTLTSRAGSTPDAYGENITTWQMSHGGFSKAMDSSYLQPWNGTASLSAWSANGVALGMFDNNATVMEVQFLSNLYKTTSSATTKAKVKASVNKAIGFVLNSQLPNGGWPQVYPKRGNYSDNATYNDNAMVRVMVMVKDLLAKKAPFDSDIADTSNFAKLRTALQKSVDFAVKAQIVEDGAPTVWCAQHDPATYAPAGARAYELASKSGSESVGIVAFLMSWPDQTAEVRKAVNGALAWYRKTRVADLKFSNGAFVASSGASMWYRFYNVENDSQFFCDRDGIKTYDFMSVSEERRTGYQWGGDYGTALLNLESVYLTALGSTSVRPREPSRLVSRRAIGREAEVAVGRDGPWEARWIAPSGAVLSAARGEAHQGRLVLPMPEQLGTSIGFLRLIGPDGSAETLPAVRMR